METLQRLLRYNGWANTRVFDLCKTLDHAELMQPAPGSVGTLAETLKHLVAVEDGYLTMLRGQDYQAAFGSREAYMQQELAWFLQRPSQVAEEYTQLVQGESAQTLQREFRMPWFSGPLSALDGYLQVVSHSSHHRAQALSVLGARGLQVPDLDYLLMVFDR